MNKSIFYFVTGAVLFLAAGFTNASMQVNVDVAVNPGAYYSHYCTIDYYGYYYCAPYYSTFGYYCDPFDPFYYTYCYAPYYSYYPTYVVNPGIVYYSSSGQAQPAQREIAGPACTDGTPAGMCSTNEPLYCVSNGESSQLIEKATLCGCQIGQVQDSTNRNRCVAQTCEDGTSLNACSTNKPLFCTQAGNLVERPQQCGCPSGTQLSGSSCIALNSACFVSTSSQQHIREGESTVVSVSYDDVESARGFVDCGNGQTVSLSCNGGNSGTCTASCTYSTQHESPFTVTAYVNGQVCSSQGSVSVAPQLPTVGDILTRVTDCSTGQVIRGATVNAGAEGAVTNANGEARVAALLPGNLAVLVNAENYKEAVATTIVTQGRTSMLPVCLEKEQACDVDVEVVGVVTTNNVENGVQLRVTNNLNEQNTATLAYSSTVSITGPLVLPLNAGQSTVISIYPQVSEEFSGSSIASVSVKGKQTCTANVEIPLNLNSGFSMRALTESQTTHAGGRACYDLLVNNEGEETEVSLTAVSNGGLTFEFNNQEFILAQGESRIARLCAVVPEGATGDRTIIINGHSNRVNDVVEQVSLRINPFMYSNVLGCFNVNGSTSQFYNVKLTNMGPRESFYARLTPSVGFSPRLTQSNLFNFENQSTRDLFVQLDQSDMQGTDARVTLSVFTKQGDVKIFEQELCFQKRGVADSLAFVSPSRIRVEQGKIARAFVYVENTGNVIDTFEVEVVPAFTNVNVVASRVSVNPGEQKTVELSITPVNTDAGTYILPIAVYSLNNQALRTRVATFNLVVDVKQSSAVNTLRLVLSSEPQVNFSSATSAITLRVPVINYEDETRIITPSLEGLPSSWSYTASPQSISIPSLGARQFEFTIAAQGMEARDYNATIVLSDELGRQVRQPVTLPAKSNNWMTGFFVLSTGASLFAFLVVILVVIGLFFLYKAWRFRQEMQREELQLEGN